MEVQDRNSLRILAARGVVGSGTGLSAAGQPVIKVFTVDAGVKGIPKQIEGISVEVVVTGEFFAFGKPSSRPGKPGGGDKIDPSTWFPRPTPIGVSTGAEWSCDTGTIGCRLFDLASGRRYALSNHHVYHGYFEYGDDGINAGVDDGVFQPSRGDDPEDDCVTTLPTYENQIGVITHFVPIQFDGSPNLVDAAIAQVKVDAQEQPLLANATPADGYGMPGLLPTEAEVGLKVQKYGRTTALTQGEVTAIGSDVFVSYGPGLVAYFVDQITVSSGGKPFIKPGDSGSLLVTADEQCSPVGLLFAGNTTGKVATANPIVTVLASFPVSMTLIVDGE